MTEVGWASKVDMVVLSNGLRADFFIYRLQPRKEHSWPRVLEPEDKVT